METWFSLAALENRIDGINLPITATVHYDWAPFSGKMASANVTTYVKRAKGKVSHDIRH